MLFKNAVVYQITKPMTSLFTDLQEKLELYKFKPCDSHEVTSQGWTKPSDVLDDLYCENEETYLFTVKKESKILPVSAVNEAVNNRVLSIEEAEHRKVYRQERVSIKEEVTFDMLPRAFSKFVKTNILVSLKHSLIIVEASTYDKGDEALNVLKDSLGSLSIREPDVRVEPASVFSQWISLEADPEKFVVAERCKLTSTCGTDEKIAFTNMSLSSEEVLNHLDNNMEVSEIAINWADTLSATLSNDLSIKSIKPLDVYLDQVSEKRTFNELLGLKSDMMLSEETIKNLTDQMFTAFGGLVTARTAA